jgi:hypothetical protein
MSDPCDNCNKPCCYGCEHAESEQSDESIAKERQERLSKTAHRAMELTHWLSYQPEMSDSERRELERMTIFLENLRDRIE